MKTTQMRLCAFSLNVWTRISLVKFSQLSSGSGLPIRTPSSTIACKFERPRNLVARTSALRLSGKSRELCSVGLKKWNFESRLTGLARLNLLLETESYIKFEVLCAVNEMEPSDNDGESSNLGESGKNAKSSLSVGATIPEEDITINTESDCVEMHVSIKDNSSTCEPSDSVENDFEMTSICKTEVPRLTEMILCKAHDVAEVFKVEDETSVDEICKGRLHEMSANKISVRAETEVRNAPQIDDTEGKTELAETGTTEETKRRCDDASVVATEVESSVHDTSRSNEAGTEEEFEDLRSLFSENSPMISSPSLKSDRHVRDDKSEGKKIQKKRKRKSTSTCVPRPNYFLGIPVSNPEIHRRVLEVQEQMVASDPAVFPHLIDVATLHLTLFVFHLQEDQLDVVKTCMTNLEDKMTNSKPSIILNFRNLGDFKNRVMFVSVVEDESYLQLVALRSAALQVFEEAGIEVQEDGEDWRPHLTVAKISFIRKTSGGAKVLRKIPASLYAEYKEDDFGPEPVSAVQLLSMRRPKDSRRYYQCESSVLLRPEGEEGDHSACCFPRRPARPQRRTEGAALSPTESNVTESSLDGTNSVLSQIPDADSVVTDAES